MSQTFTEFDLISEPYRGIFNDRVGILQHHLRQRIKPLLSGSCP